MNQESAVAPPKKSRFHYPRLRNILGIGSVVLAAFVGMSAWAFSSAVGGAPDDDYHLSSMWCTSFSGPDCEFDADGNGVMIPPPLLVSSYCLYHNPQQGAGCQPFMDGTDPREDFAFGHNNPMRQLNPDGFYQAGNVFKTKNIQSTVLEFRLFNVSIFLALTIALYFLLPRRLTITAMWMWLIGLIPLGVYLIASTNPSSWAIIAVGTGWLALMGYLETKDWRSAGLAVVYLLSVLLATSSRVDSILYLGLVSALAVCQAPLPIKDLFKKTWVALVAAVFVVIRLIISPRNLERSIGGVSSHNNDSEGLPWTTGADSLLPAQIDGALMWNNLWSVPGLWTGVFGGRPLGSLGWLDTALPQIVFFGVGGTLLGLIFVAIKRPGAKKALSMGAVFFALWAIPLYLLQISGALAGEEFQPRYLVPLMVVAVGTVVLTQDGRPLISDRPRLVAIAAALTVSNSIALHTNIRRYVTGNVVEGLNLNSPREWWWGFLPDLVSPNFVWVAGTAAFGVVAWFAFVHLPGLRADIAVESGSNTKPSNQPSTLAK